MAKAKTNSTDLDKKLKSADELIDGAETLANRFQDQTNVDKENILNVKKSLVALKRLKEELSEAPDDTMEKLDKVIDKLRNISKDNQKATEVSESEKDKTLELLDSVLDSLNDKINEHKVQSESGQSKKKGKGQNRTEKIEKWIENLSYHTEKLEEIKKRYEIDALIEQDQALKEIISFLQDYIANTEYQQHKQTAYIDGLYESFEKQEDTELNTSLQNEEELETDSTATKTTTKETAQESIQESGHINEDGPDAAERKAFMSRIRQSNFEHEIGKMPKVSEKDTKGEYNFFEVFEASARNIPQETDYAPNASTKERISTKNIYPKRRLVSEQIFERFDVDTLFFIFYFQKDTYEQCLAAKELKRRAWRFHKKYLTWFKRLEAPRVTNDEYEQGTYAFFDFEPGGWCQRRKGDFTFKYSYLEDDKV